MLTELQKKTIGSLVSLLETGSFRGDASLIAILSDGAGISYGICQATENSGSLWKLLFETYASHNGNFGSQLLPYKDRLFQEGKDERKDALTSDKSFISLLRQAGEEDDAMRQAQEAYFAASYFVPALEAAKDWFENPDPLVVGFLCDVSIHSGPKGMKQFISKFDQSEKTPAQEDFEEEEPIVFERAWGKALIEYRHSWLANFKGKTEGHTKAVRRTTYRSKLWLDLAEREVWDLALPLEVLFNGRKKVLDPPSLWETALW